MLYTVYIYHKRQFLHKFYCQKVCKAISSHMDFCMDSLKLSYDMLYTLLCNTLKVLERRDCNDHKNPCNCTFEVP